MLDGRRRVARCGRSRRRFSQGLATPKAKENVQFARDLGALNAYVKDLLPSGTLLTVSPALYTVKPGDTLASIAASRTPPIHADGYSGSQSLQAGIFSEDVEITIPPTSRLFRGQGQPAERRRATGHPGRSFGSKQRACPRISCQRQQLSLPSIKVKTLLNELQGPNGS